VKKAPQHPLRLIPRYKMDTKSSTNTTTNSTPPEVLVSEVMKEGFANMGIQASIGLGTGFLAGLVLARGGGASATRKIIAGFGGGIGLGSAWTKCSIQLEEALGAEKN